MAQAQSEWVALTAAQRDVLIAVPGEEQPSGADVLAALDEHYSRATVYDALDELGERGLVTTRPVDGRTKRYELTDRGWGVLQEHRERVQVPPES